jgi:U3 small nucleolar RNA-associated protein 18
MSKHNLDAVAQRTAAEETDESSELDLDEADGESEVSEDVDVQMDDEEEKDDSEEELERLVFGDSAGFSKGLSAYAAEQDRERDLEEQQATGLEGLDDAEVGQALSTA